MKHLTTLISALFFLVIGVSHVWALPACPSSGYLNNCYGTFVWDSGDKYVGEFKEGLPHGQGTHTFVNREKYDTSEYGEKYEGEFQDLHFHGQGTLTFPDGSKWVGAWKNSQLNGYAVTYYADGSINQEGIFKDNKFLKAQTKPKAPHVWALPACPSSGYFHNCYGTHTWGGGLKYIGDWKNNKKNGQGTLTSGKGDKYVGDWKDDKYHGQGTVTFANGNSYVGEFKNGKKHGQGTYTWASGNSYVGEYENGKRQGHGTFTWANGDKHVGEYENGKRQGHGTLTWASGDSYVGEYENGKRQGQGTFTSANGSIQEGIWKSDKFLKAQTKPKAPKVFSSVQNEGLTALPSEKDFLDAIYGGRAIRRLFEVDIVSFDGFFETETIYLAEVKATIKESKLPDFLREGQWKLVFIEEGMSASEAAATVNTMRMLDSFNDGLNLFLDALGSPVNNTSSKNGSRTFTDTYRFGKGSKKWIYIPDKQTSTSSNDTYDTDFQGWVNKYSDF